MQTNKTALTRRTSSIHFEQVLSGRFWFQLTVSFLLWEIFSFRLNGRVRTRGENQDIQVNRVQTRPMIQYISQMPTELSNTLLRTRRNRKPKNYETESHV